MFFLFKRTKNEIHNPPEIIQTNLINPVTKNQPKSKLKSEAEYTISSYKNKNLIEIYTDGSSDTTLQNGGIGIYAQYPNNQEIKISKGGGEIASNYTCELRAIRQALETYMESNNKGNGLVIFSDSKASLDSIKAGNKHHEINIIINYITKINKDNLKCFLQWIPAHVDIMGNEIADKLAKEGRTKKQEKYITYQDANVIAKHSIIPAHIKNNILENSENLTREETTTLTHIKTKHLLGMTINADGSRTYKNCKTA
jgi:ribonuclease HI